MSGMTRDEKLPPGPRAPSAFQTMGWWTRPHAYMERLRDRYGRRFTLRLAFAPPFVMHSEPEHVKEIFTAPPEKLHPGEGASVLEPIVGKNSVILLDEAAHLEQRKLMLPAFHGERMQRLSAIVDEVTEREVASWPRDETFELHPRLQALTMEVILRAVFGLDPGRRLDELRERLTAMMQFSSNLISMFPQVQQILGRRGPYGDFFQIRDEADALLFELIDERRADDAKRDDVLSMLLEARHDDDGSPMSHQELRDELMTLLVAGHETTASELAWAFVRLAREPEVTERLAEDVDSGDGSYVEATINETLRRRPVLPNAAPRLVVEPIEVGGWSYEPGVCLVANSYLLHHDPEIYPDPYAFRPERFLEQAPGTYTLIPFGGGRRRCLGASFAILEMKAVLRAVFSTLELRPATDLELTRRRAITVSPRVGARTVLRDRKRVRAGERPAAAPV
jgi:cytochrome P450